MRSFAIAAWIAVGVSATAAPAQSSGEPSVYRGRVVGVLDERTGEPIEGVEVRNLLNGLSALTTSTGTLSLFFVDTAGGMLSFKKLGYEPQTMVVANSVRDTTPVTVILKPVGQVLPTVVTSAKSQGDVVQYMSPALKGFEERRRQALGHFVAEAELRKNDAEKLSDIIMRYVAGVHLVPPQTGPNGMHSSELYLVSQRNAGNVIQSSGPCYVTVYVDGTLFYSKKTAGRGLSPPDMRSFGVNEYAGIEYYAGGATMPPQYNMTDSGCGVLLLWTRER